MSQEQEDKTQEQRTSIIGKRGAIQLGFGGSNLLGDKTHQQGIALLETAFDNGIRHYDVAPYYGYGDSEKLIGEFAKGKRNQISIATKFGIHPLGKLAESSTLIRIARKAMRAYPFVRKLVKRNARKLSQGGKFDLSSAQASLENSLRALKTDFIEIYLLHECRLTDCTLELLEFLEKMKGQGKIGRIGIGTQVSFAEQICFSRPEFSSVVQFRSTISDHNLSIIRNAVSSPTFDRTLITHGALTILAKIKAKGESDPGWSARWTRNLGADVNDIDSLAGLALRHAMSANETGIVLFQSSSCTRIKSNILKCSTARWSDEQIKSFEELGNELKVIQTRSAW